MNRLSLGGIFRVKCFDSSGKLRWEDTTKNMVVNVGLHHILDLVFSLGGASANANYYIGLTDGTPVFAAADVMTSHAGWVEDANYTEGVRQEYVEVRSNLDVSNTASKATFSINATTTIGGAFVVSDNSGTAGLLFAGAAFSNGDKSVFDGDTIEVQYDFSASSS